MLWTSPACDPLSRESHLFSSHLSSVFCLLPLALSLLPFAFASVSLSLRPLRPLRPLCPLCLSFSLSLVLSFSRPLFLSFSRLSLVLSSSRLSSSRLSRLSRSLVLSSSLSLSLVSLSLSLSLSFSLSRSLSLSLSLSFSLALSLLLLLALTPFFLKRSTHLRDVSRTTLWVRWMLPARGGL